MTPFTGPVINRFAEAAGTFARFGRALPPRVSWTPAVWSSKGPECNVWNNNFFLVDYGTRFPKIIEDEPRNQFLCHEYP